MDKKEFFKKVKDKVDKKTFDEIWTECEKDAKDRGVPDKDLEAVTISMVQAALKKRLLSPAKEFEGIIFGIDPSAALNNTVDKVKLHALDEKKRNADEAFANNYINDKGNPVWHAIEGVKVADFKLGKEITDRDYQQNLIMLAKQTDEEGDYRIAKMKMYGDKRLHDTSLLFKTLKFRANLNEKKSTDEQLMLGQSTATEFSVQEEEQLDFEKVAKKYLKPHVTELGKLGDFIIKHEENKYDAFCVVQANVSNINITAAGISNILTLDDLDLGMDESITGWIDESYNIDIVDNAIGVIAIGSPRLGKDDKLSINIYGLWAPEMWRIKETPSEVGEEESEEVVEEVNEEK